MKRQFYKDKVVEIKVNENLDIVDMPKIWLICIEAWITGRLTWCKLAKNPMELRKSCKEQLEIQISIVERELTEM